MHDKSENHRPEIETEKPEKTVKTVVRARGGAGLTFLGLGLS
jgi:hypothetical protein